MKAITESLFNKGNVHFQSSVHNICICHIGKTQLTYMAKEKKPTDKLNAQDQKGNGASRRATYSHEHLIKIIIMINNN